MRCAYGALMRIRTIFVLPRSIGLGEDGPPPIGWSTLRVALDKASATLCISINVCLACVSPLEAVRPIVAQAANKQF